MKFKEVPNRFKNARLHAGLSAAEVERMSPYLTKQGIHNYEKGISLPSNLVLFEFHKFYGASLDYLLKTDNYINHVDFVKQTLLLNEEAINILIKLKENDISLYEFEAFLYKLKKEKNHGNSRVKK